jgi:glucose-6-phosphate 1-dehydrogenase
MKNAFVILGISGDLSKRKLLPAFWEVARDRNDVDLVGYSRSKVEVKDICPHSDYSKITLLRGEYTNLSELFQILSSKNYDHIDFHLALPTEIFPQIIIQIVTWKVDFKIILEKPYFKNEEELSEISKFDNLFPGKILLIDHYLGKAGFRTLLESSIELTSENTIQINFLEEMGVEGRGGFYDKVGIIWDIFHSHILQILTKLLSIKLKISKVEVLSSIYNQIKSKNYKMELGQYEGYISDLGGISLDSKTPTEMDLKFELFLLDKNFKIHVVAGKKRSWTESSLNINNEIFDLKSDNPLSAYGFLYNEVLDKKYDDFLRIEEAKLQYQICKELSSSHI